MDLDIKKKITFKYDRAENKIQNNINNQYYACSKEVMEIKEVNI